jgi:hypothetical protein
MKKSFLLFFCFLCVFKGFSQHVETDKPAAFALISKTQAQLGFSAEDMANLRVAQSYSNPLINVSYIYLQQTYKGIPVHNRIIVLAYKNGQLMSKSGTLLNNIESYSNGISENPSIEAETAVRAAADYVKAKSPDVAIALSQDNGKINFGPLGIAYENVTAQLFWYPVEKAGEKTTLKLAWQIMIAPLTTDDMWYVRVDAHSDRAIDKQNLTVFEQFDPHAAAENNMAQANTPAATIPAATENSPSLVGTANYLVIPYPVESPLYGPVTLVTNPWTLAGSVNPNATALKWHNDGTNDYTITRGNNVWATEGQSGGNLTNTIQTPIGIPATSSTTPDPLTFNFPPDYTVAPTNPAFQQLAITNLFYWNNIMHDMSYNYGFDEVSGNFQATNQGRGGGQGDYVIAIAQSAAGTNNANFGTPADGGRGRMRMYLFTSPNPDRDGDLDAGIMAHEYTHGISSRLTGGIAGGAGCLGNAEEGGEGWSDYFALMMTTNWATSQITDGFNIRRPMGNYVQGQGTTGGGIRSRPYSTNFAVNNLTYAFVQSSGGEVHDIGELWCATLWDMTWNIIQMDGINTNLFNAGGTGGNSVALKLVIEGMRLQPCNPGFLDARDAILRADKLIYNSRYHCAILAAFARRGMGTDAKQGSSNSTSDQTVGFSTVETALTLTQNVTQQQEGLNITYTNNVLAGLCSGITNYTLTDTLPSNVTYVSGGTYNAATRVVSFVVNLAAGANQNYSFTVQVNPGSYYPPTDLLSEPVAGTTIPATWAAQTTVPAGGTTWVVSSAQSHSAPNSFFGADRTVASDMRLSTVTPVPLGAIPPVFSFWHKYDTEDGWDGGVVEISTNNGTTWTDLGSGMIVNGYNSFLGAGTGNNLANRAAFTGNSGSSFIQTKISLQNYANQSALFRFRCASDDNTAATGWFVDDILLRSEALVNIRTSLFNGSVRVLVADTSTIILPNTACTPVAISTQPVDATVCSGNTATFNVTASGSSPTYQWQISTDGGTNYTAISGATTATLTLTNVTTAMNGNKYKVIISNTCPSTLTSNAATLTVNPGVSVTTQPVSATVCAGATATFTTATAGTAPTLQWQVSTDGGTTFTNIAGATSNTLTLTGVTAAMNNNQYHLVVTNACPSTATSSNVTLTVQTAPAITTQPAAASTCTGNTATFTVVATGTNLTYQWQTAPTCGLTFTNIIGATSATLSIPNVTAAMAGTAYRVVVSGNCTPSSATSNCVTITVNTTTTITGQPASAAACAGAPVTFTTAATGSSITYQWQVSTNGGTTFTDIAGATATSYTIAAAAAAQNGNQYRAVLSSTCAAALNTNAATLTVSTPPSITTQPADVAVCATSATLSVVAAGTGLSYQWQVSIDGGTTFTNIAGATSPALALNNLTAAMATWKYRVVVSGGTCGTATSNSVTVRVGSNPSVVLTPAPVSTTNPSRPTELYTTISPAGNYSFAWYRNGILLPAYSSSPVFTDILDEFGTYKVIITDIATGCTAASNTITINDIAAERNRLFIYPNPTGGIVQLSYYSDDAATQTRMLNLYDSKGSRVMAKTFITAGRYGRMNIDLSQFANGVYHAELRDASGKKLASESIIKY